jgi:acyl-CoA thioester hydrolase
MNKDLKSAELSDFPITVSIPVQWGDQDAFGHVNNTAAIRWMESARIAYLDQAGLHNLMTNESVGVILASITCHYRQQINFPDTVTVGARVMRLGNTSVTMEHVIHSQQLDRVAADGTSVVVLFDYENNHPTRIPASVRETIERFEGKQS